MEKNNEIAKLAVKYEKKMYGYHVNLKDELETDEDCEQNIIDVHEAYISGYCEGADRQKKEDIDRAFEWMHDRLVEDYPEILGYANLLKSIEKDFRNYMKKE